MGVSPVSSRVGTYKRNSFGFPAVAWPGAALVEMSDLYLKSTLSTLTPWRKSQMSRRANKKDGQEEPRICLRY